jgi:holo-[acyl-carrier protein] synthase
MAIGVGVDAVDVERFRVSLGRTPTLRTRLFTAEELAYVAPKVDPVPSLAVRFAAREAVMKALGVGLGAFGFHDVWVRRAESGVPSLEIHGSARALADAAGVTRWHVSLTHTDLLAVAYVLAE